MSEPNGLVRRRLSRKTVVIAGVVTLVLGVGLAATALATDRPGFCDTCHEMRPYYAAWSGGPHKDAWCINCHVDSGIVARFLHKPEALKEVVAHFGGDNKFPRPDLPSVPNERCLRCHPTPGPRDPEPGFVHEEHARRADCQQCHVGVGHDVSEQELRVAGIFSASAARERARKRVTGVASPGRGVANVKNHRKVVCTECHDMARTGCPLCHEKPDDKAHAGYAKSCSACHRPGKQWAFAHPSSRNCNDCHGVPKRADHRGRTRCGSCHRTRSWAFVHPSGNCANCHGRPANHFSGACSNCHSPSRAFSSAVFSHPGISGGEHSYRSFACSKCHPGGGSRVSCTCHGGGTSFSDD